MKNVRSLKNFDRQHLPEIEIRNFKPSFNSRHLMVFDKIFSFLSVRDLKNCNLVNRQWAESAKNQLQKKTIVRMDSLEKVQCFMSDFGQQTNFHSNFIFEGPSGMACYIMQFFQLFGKHIIMLEIRKCSWLGKSLPYIMQSTPNLQRLTLRGRASSEDTLYPHIPKEDIAQVVNTSKNYNWPHLKLIVIDIGGYAEDIRSWCVRSDPGKIQPFIFQLLLAAPNLSIINCPSIDPSFSKVVLHTIIFQHDLKLPKLQKIDLRTKVTNLDLKTLQFKRFPLVHFNLTVKADVSLFILHNLLGSIGSTLRYLKLTFEERDAINSQFFPSSSSLKVLEELVLVRFSGSLIFLYDLVTLEKFYLEDVCLRTVFTSPLGDPIPLPIGFRVETLLNLNFASIGCVRERSFIAAVIN